MLSYFILRMAYVDREAKLKELLRLIREDIEFYRRWLSKCAAVNDVEGQTEYANYISCLTEEFWSVMSMHLDLQFSESVVIPEGEKRVLSLATCEAGGGAKCSLCKLSYSLRPEHTSDDGTLLTSSEVMQSVTDPPSTGCSVLTVLRHLWQHFICK